MSSIILKRVQSGDIARSHDIGRVVHALEELPENKSWRVTVEEAKSTRSTNQNAYYWGVVIEMMCEATGYDPEEVHEYLCGARWGWRDKRIPKTPRNPEGIESVPVRTTTINEHGKRSILNVTKFGNFIEFARRFAVKKLNLMIPDPDPLWKIHRERERQAA